MDKIKRNVNRLKKVGGKNEGILCEMQTES